METRRRLHRGGASSQREKAPLLVESPLSLVGARAAVAHHPGALFPAIQWRGRQGTSKDPTGIGGGRCPVKSELGHPCADRHPKQAFVEWGVSDFS